ncbi:hypothetical protein PISL3812_01467 [Talaromyces islandicus]|uniref:Uncharacterized protein n=1 Tax=Talaromyces islandicus TaxID=28573 RepID=A0A0U1LM73_TALIS|nr:hypothetical protein PISL3812_01467 [Talaromyces islandicus]
MATDVTARPYTALLTVLSASLGLPRKQLRDAGGAPCPPLIEQPLTLSLLPATYCDYCALSNYYSYYSSALERPAFRPHPSSSITKTTSLSFVNSLRRFGVCSLTPGGRLQQLEYTAIPPA